MRDSHSAVKAVQSSVRQDFPIFAESNLAYLDSAATTQKPQQVIDAISSYYAQRNANIHRGVYKLAEAATCAYETARSAAANFICGTAEEIVFTKGATEAINLVAHSFIEPILREGDEILLSLLEHHSNIVPWHIVSSKTGAKLKFVGPDENGEVGVDAFQRAINSRTKFIAITHVSNVIGCEVPVAAICNVARNAGIPTLVDGAQAVPHLRIDVNQIGCDFYVFSAHKMYGPTGTGILWAKPAYLERMQVYQGGGDMIATVTTHGFTAKTGPAKFEAGTPNIAGVIGLGTAIEYLAKLPQIVWENESSVLTYAERKIAQIKGVHVLGNPARRIGVLSFTLEGVHPHDIATIADSFDVAIRAGHHCAQPLMSHLGIPAAARASFGIYNQNSDVKALVKAIEKCKTVFA